MMKYNQNMHFFKRFLRGLSSQIFKSCLYLLAMITAVVIVFGEPTQLKKTIHASRIYDKIVSSVLDQSQSSQANSADNIPINDPLIQQAAQAAFPPNFLEQSTNQVIDGIYGWLQGKTESPEFEIKLGDAKQRFATAVGDIAANRVSKLPICTLQQLRTQDLNNLDPFAVPCQPPGINIKAEQSKIMTSINNDENFLQDTTISADTLTKQNGQTIFDQASVAPTTFQWFTRLPYLLGGLGILAGSSMVFLHEDKRRGIWVIGRTLLFSGVVLLVGAFLAMYLANQFHIQNFGAGNTAIESSLQPIVRSLTNALNRVIYTFAGFYLLIGSTVMLTIHLTRPKQQSTNPLASKKIPNGQKS